MPCEPLSVPDCDATPAWVECACGDYWCTEHDAHAYDCHCPPIEDWARLGLSPYCHEHPGDEAFL